jgi:hypothetical protein
MKHNRREQMQKGKYITDHVTEFNRTQRKKKDEKKVPST